MLLGPGLLFGRLSASVVVNHEVDGAQLEDGAVDVAQKSQKFFGLIAQQAVVGDRARFHIEVFDIFNTFVICRLCEGVEPDRDARQGRRMPPSNGSSRAGSVYGGTSAPFR